MKIFVFYYYYYSSGRTSRREIRKLLWECLFWRIKRAKANRQGSKIHTHSFLFDDDDDDTERSIATTAVTPYCALTIHSQNRSSYLSRNSSSHTNNNNSNYPIQLPRRSSFYTCCGFTIDLSHKQSLYSSNGDVTSRRSTICKSPTSNNNINNNNKHTHASPRKFRTYSHSPLSLSSFDRKLRRQNQQQISYLKSDDDIHHQLYTRSRASTTIVHSFRHRPSSTTTSITNHSVTLNTDTIFPRRSISEAQGCSSVDTLPLSNTSDTPTITDVNNENTNSVENTTESTVVVENLLKEEILPAYIIETC